MSITSNFYVIFGVKYCFLKHLKKYYMLKDLSEYNQLKKSSDGQVVVTGGTESNHNSRAKSKATFKERREMMK